MLMHYRVFRDESLPDVDPAVPTSEQRPLRSQSTFDFVV